MFDFNKPINPKLREMNVLCKPLACKARACRRGGSADQRGLFIQKQLPHRGSIGRSRKADRAVTELIDGHSPWLSRMEELCPHLNAGNGSKFSLSNPAASCSELEAELPPQSKAMSCRGDGCSGAQRTQKSPGKQVRSEKLCPHVQDLFQFAFQR